MLWLLFVSCCFEVLKDIYVILFSTRAALLRFFANIHTWRGWTPSQLLTQGALTASHQDPRRTHCLKFASGPKMIDNVEPPCHTALPMECEHQAHNVKESGKPHFGEAQAHSLLHTDVVQPCHTLPLLATLTKTKTNFRRRS